MEKKLGAVLRELRKKKKLTAKETVDKLLSMGYEISDKTLSGYETGIRMPNADVFMALCKIYDCKNILQIFSFVKADYSIPTDDEWIIIEKYRFLDPHGKKMVDFTLNEEWARSQELKDDIKVEPTEFSAEIVPIKEYLAPDAAHPDESLSKATSEMVQSENDIMDDENF